MSHPRILVVDDEPALVELLSYHLRSAHYEVATAGNGWEAFAQVRNWHPELILLDLMLPDLDGFAFCEILRRDQATATIPVIIVSAWASSDSRNLGLELGALEYVTKPFSPHAVVNRVNRLFAQRASRPAKSV